MPFTTILENAHRRRIIELSFEPIVAAADRLKKRYRSALNDIDLTVEDLGQFGCLKAVECYDRLFADNPQGILAMAEDELRRSIVSLAMHCIACHIIDVYRMRDRRRAAIAPDHLVAQIDDTGVRRVELWRRIEPVMAAGTPRPRRILAELLNGADTEDVSVALGLSANAVLKDVAAIRKVAVCC